MPKPRGTSPNIPFLSQNSAQGADLYPARKLSLSIVSEGKATFLKHCSFSFFFSFPRINPITLHRKIREKGSGNLHAAGFSLGLSDIYNTSGNRENHSGLWTWKPGCALCVCVCACVWALIF